MKLIRSSGEGGLRRRLRAKPLSAIFVFLLLGACSASRSDDSSNGTPRGTLGFALSQGSPTGWIDRVGDDPGNVSIAGWACGFGDPNPTWVHLYTESSFGTGPNTFIAATLANLPNEQAVNDACGAGGSHRYSYTFSTAEVRKAGGQRIWAFGIGLDGAPNAALLGGGKFMPATIPTQSDPTADSTTAISVSAGPEGLAHGVASWSILSNGSQKFVVASDSGGLETRWSWVLNTATAGETTNYTGEPPAWVYFRNGGQLAILSDGQTINTMSADEQDLLVGSLRDLTQIGIPQSACSNYLWGQEMKLTAAELSAIVCGVGNGNAIGKLLTFMSCSYSGIQIFQTRGQIKQEEKAACLTPGAICYAQSIPCKVMTGWCALSTTGECAALGGDPGPPAGPKPPPGPVCQPCMSSGCYVDTSCGVPIGCNLGACGPSTGCNPTACDGRCNGHGTCDGPTCYCIS